MPRLISFALTTPQIRARTKTVTRRLGWLHARVGDELRAVEKVQGRKKGEPLVDLARIRIVSVRRESLYDITYEDVEREGYPDKTPGWFATMFCAEMGCPFGPVTVTRIEFEYVEAEP